LALSKTPGLGARIDITLSLIRLGFFFNDIPLITSNLTKADDLINQGGDWDRLNRLKVYRALHLVSVRQFKRAGELLVDALSTFTATELLDYNDFVTMTVLVNTLVLKRVDLKKKVTKPFCDWCPHWLTTRSHIDHLSAGSQSSSSRGSRLGRLYKISI
jgi:26S proteasome regulatory subunit N7